MMFLLLLCLIVLREPSFQIKVCLQERKLGHICITALHAGFRELFKSNFSLSVMKSANELKIIKSQSLDTLNLHLFLCLWHAAVSIEVITESFHG